MIELCGRPRHSPDIRVIAGCYQKWLSHTDTRRYQGDRWLLSEMISLRCRVNEALCGRNGRQRRVRCHGAASVPHLSRNPQRVASSPAVSCPVSRPSRIPWRRVRVVSTAPRPCRVSDTACASESHPATPRSCRVNDTIRRAVSRAASTSHPRCRPCRRPWRAASRGAAWAVATRRLAAGHSSDQKCRAVAPRGPPATSSRPSRGSARRRFSDIRVIAGGDQGRAPSEHTCGLRATGNIVTPVAEGL